MQLGRALIGLLLTILFALPHTGTSASQSKASSLQATRNKVSVVRSAPAAMPASRTHAKPRRRSSTPARAALRKQAAKTMRRAKRKQTPARPKDNAMMLAASQTRAPHAREAATWKQTQRTLALQSNAAFVLDQASSEVLLDKNADKALPIASLTKLMTALVVFEAAQDMTEMLEVTGADIDRIKYSASRLPVGARLSRSDMLHIALMSSENRAASALGRHYPGGISAFVAAMNAKAKALGMTATRFVEPTGLSSANVASARDLSKLVAAAQAHRLIARYSTSPRHVVNTGRSTLQYVNSNRLVGQGGWQIDLQKTGYIAEAGRCLVMKATIDHRPVVMVFLNSDSHLSRFADARRTRDWFVQRPERKVTAQITQAPDRS